MPLSCLKKIPVGVIGHGSKLNFSVYNKAGKLVLSKGRIISSVKQSRFINTQGYFKEDLTSAEVFDDSSSQEEDDNHTIVCLIRHWMKTLLILRTIYQQPVINFSHLVLEMALNLQLQCKRDSNLLLMAIQIKIDKDYNIINAIHSAVICEIIGKQSGLTQLERLPIIAGALTHDIGFEELQNKLHVQSGKLTEEQKSAIKKHPIISEAILKNQGVKDKVWLDVVRHHHERLDGSGYPDGLVEEELSIGVKIMAIADTYVAICRSNSYRPDSSSNMAIKTIYKNRKRFDEKMIYAFIDLMGIYPLGSIVRLKNKELAFVTSVSQSISSPIVTILQDSKVFIEQEVVVRDTALEQYQIIRCDPVEKYPYLQPQIRQLLL